jgi:hypothetical protein
MATKIIDQLMDELRQLMREDPQNPQWKKLLNRVRRDAEKPPSKAKLARARSPQPDPQPVRETDQTCWLCEISPAAESGALCVDCDAMYGMVSARLIPGLCDCGHPPDGMKVYLYRYGRKEESLCGRSCVQRHFRQVFEIFLGSR